MHVKILRPLVASACSTPTKSIYIKFWPSKKKQIILILYIPTIYQKSQKNLSINSEFIENKQFYLLNAGTKYTHKPPVKLLRIKEFCSINTKIPRTLESNRPSCHPKASELFHDFR